MDYVRKLLRLILPYTVLCRNLPSPVNLTMDSCHFVHLLTWQAGPGSPEGLQYFVKVRTIGTVWKTVESCAIVHSPLCCNLTDVFFDPQETYYINVTAFLGNETSISTPYKPFKPVKDTIPESPLLRVLPCNESLCVYLQSPSLSLYSLYETLPYILNVASERADEFSIATRGLGTVILRHLAPDQQYCVSVSSTVCLANSAINPPVCASTSAAEHMSDAAISTILYLLVLVFAVFGVLLVASGFVCLKTHLPSVLSSFQRPYKELLLAWSTVGVQTHILLLPNTLKDVSVDVEREEDMDQEREDEQVAYERRIGCEEISEEMFLFYPTANTEIQYASKIRSLVESQTHVPQNYLNKQMSVHTGGLHWQMKAPETTSQTFTTCLLPLETNIQVFTKKNLYSHKHTRGDAESQEDQAEAEVNVNLFSLTLGGEGEQQENDNEKNEKMENMHSVVLLHSLRPAETTMDIQPTFSQAINSYISNTEDEEEEEYYAGYVKRN